MNIVSIRSPHKSKGRHPATSDLKIHGIVSIRSPHKSKGRQDFQRVSTCYISFNPLPSQKQGETCPHRRPNPRHRCFNPLPSQKQGETTQWRILLRAIGVSIRSPHKSKGRLLSLIDVRLNGQVSIRSPHKSKGRHYPDQRHKYYPQCFNPLPSQKQGETPYLHHSQSVASVSIRSPHKSKGRPTRTNRSNDLGKFQSAPLTKARGDKLMADPALPGSGFNPLPSQKQGETSPPSTFDVDFSVSIRSPHKSKGRQLLPEVAQRKFEVSIRSPHKSKGRPLWRFSGRSGRFVSIRSPHKSKGRRPFAAPALFDLMFQSAPLTKARGDSLLFFFASNVSQFQSAPLTKARGDAIQFKEQSGLV